MSHLSEDPYKWDLDIRREIVPVNENYLSILYLSVIDLVSSFLLLSICDIMNVQLQNMYKLTERIYCTCTWFLFSIVFQCNVLILNLFWDSLFRKTLHWSPTSSGVFLYEGPKKWSQLAKVPVIQGLTYAKFSCLGKAVKWGDREKQYYLAKVPVIRDPTKREFTVLSKKEEKKFERLK